MTPCTRYPDDDAIVRYVTSDLPEPDQSAFEDHLFSCDACLARVEHYQAAQQVLASEGPVVPAAPLSFPVPGVPRKRGVSIAWWAYASLAAALVVAVGGALWTPRPVTPHVEAARAQGTPAPSHAEPASAPTAVADMPSADGQSSALQVAVLAMVTPPPYIPMTMRGDAASAAFTRGMEAYVARDWVAASRSLQQVESPAGRFYYGVSELMRGDAATATEAFDAARASGTEPYATESLFYLAKSALRIGNVDKAREWLTAASSAGAGPPREASRLLQALETP